MADYIIVGGGIAGLLSAYLSAEKGKQVVLIEREKECGGLLRSFQYSENDIFDYGIHTLYETGNVDLDSLLKSFLPDDSWIENAGHKRDFGGTYINAVLQDNSPYIDLRNLPENLYSELVDDFFQNLNKPIEENKSAKEYFESKFGSKITEHVISPVLGKLYPSLPLSELHPFLGKLLPLERMVFFGEEVMNALNLSSSIRSHVAHTDQLTVPSHLLPNKSSWYPKDYGMAKYIEAICTELKSKGVKILTSSTLKSLSKEGSQFECDVETGDGLMNLTAEKILWTSGIPAAYFNLLEDSQRSNFAFDRPVSTAIVNVSLTTAPEVSELFYVYCLEKGYLTHRLSCPSSFCPASYRDGVFRMGVELILNKDIDNEEIKKKVTSELKDMGICKPEDMINIWVEKVSGGYPTLSLKNVSAINSMRDQLHDQFGGSVLFYGNQSKANLFFQTDVLMHVLDDFKNEKY